MQEQQKIISDLKEELKNENMELTEIKMLLQKASTK